MLSSRIVTCVVLGTLTLATPAAAAEGVYEIKQSCVATGCFTGDTPGFPVQINSPGSYRLISNLQVPDANTSAIEVFAPSVVLDLNGFEISGVTACDYFNDSCAPVGVGKGVRAEFGSTAGTIVRNGTVRGMGNIGVRVNGGGIVEDVMAYGNGWAGISVQSSVVRSSVARFNGATGIVCTDCIASGNTVSSNLGSGISAGVRALLIDNVISLNDWYGIEGVLQSPGYGRNLLGGNNGGDAQPQVEPGIGVQIGTNVCGTDTVCP